MTRQARILDAADPAAVARLRELLAEAEQADGAPPVSDQALLAAVQGRRRIFDFGKAVGILGEGELDLVVRPDSRGAGVGTAALARLLTEDLDRGELRVWAHGENPAARSLLARAGFAPARTLLRLALDPARLPAAIADARPLPAGFRVRPFDPADPEQARDWVRVNAAAFADHPEQGAVTVTDFAALTAESWFDPADLRLAYDATAGAAERLAGYAWVKTVHEPAGTGTELYVLGVDPDYAGRGLGAALLGETLRRMAEHGPDRIALYVDGGNERALPLYERAGFALDQRSTQWLRPARMPRDTDSPGNNR